ncbi:MarR family transcriptional regulator [Pseudonocardia sp. KRD291]|uniref:MarR family winged helix-turn-helix transcriptional regulator n=1 Tax=Pseudonocardia sp. KRD291 TaxID=2792007 RepID=UPI001C5C1DAD|nr:MarR family transcriptional regulator [Pseudonocardia sp. KRD291]MBW0105299.1 MarR family transcriptional regulator [Pseudonocardia sp. KRD291]
MPGWATDARSVPGTTSRSANAIGFVSKTTACGGPVCGYLLKEASSALRAAMEEVLRPLGTSVTHYSCLELLAQRPGLSNSELARGAFVTRQSMNVLLQTLEREGSVTRPAAAPVGKVLPTRLTPRGRANLEKATAAVRSVEVRMLAGMTGTEQSEAFRILQSMTRSLRDGDDGA